MLTSEPSSYIWQMWTLFGCECSCWLTWWRVLFCINSRHLMSLYMTDNIKSDVTHHQTSHTIRHHTPSDITHHQKPSDIIVWRLTSSDVTHHQTLHTIRRHTPSDVTHHQTSHTIRRYTPSDVTHHQMSHTIRRHTPSLWSQQLRVVARKLLNVLTAGIMTPHSRDHNHKERLWPPNYGVRDHDPIPKTMTPNQGPWSQTRDHDPIPGTMTPNQGPWSHTSDHDFVAGTMTPKPVQCVVMD